ncbi:MAG: hypothetical protein NC302_01565 [Bacteroidales bacterium]|nr:hypothetical protein [Bacteroidales bacterium]MCM1414662.1 hypothetical protein [bacterium]
MSINGIGSRNTYIYNLQTNRLATKDGSKDTFVDYFNGEISGDGNDSLNGFDVCRKNDIENMIGIWLSQNHSNICSDSVKNEFEITAEVIDAAESSYSIDGKKAFTAYHMGFFSLIDYAELTKALAEKAGLSKCKGTSEQNQSINVVNDASQTAISTEKNEEKNRRFAIPPWLENKALKEYEEWLCRPLSEREFERSRK